MTTPTSPPGEDEPFADDDWQPDLGVTEIPVLEDIDYGEDSDTTS